MITVRTISIRNGLALTQDKDMEAKLTELSKLGRIVSVIPVGNNMFQVVVLEHENTVTVQTTDITLADRLEKLSTETGLWFAGDLVGDEDQQVVSIGGYDLSDRPAKDHHYEDTILEVWDNGNIEGNAVDTAALLCELVNNLPVIIKALRNDSSELTVHSFKG